MSETAVNEGASHDSEKPVEENNTNLFPPFPDPTPNDFDEEITEDEIVHYKEKFKDLKTVTTLKLHCTACDKHLGCKPRNELRMRMHPLLRTLICNSCHTFYNSGEFEKGEDGSELYCRWCGQGGQVYCCSDCHHVFCAKCIKRNLGNSKIKEIENTDDWKCFKCNPLSLWDLRATCWALLRYCDFRNRFARDAPSPELKQIYDKENGKDTSICCSKTKRRDSKKKEIENATNKKTAAVLTKIPSSIQVKKFAALPVEDLTKEVKKATKRPNQSVKTQIPILPGAKLMKPVILPSAVPMKKMRMPTSSTLIPGYQRIEKRTYQPAYNVRPKLTKIQMIPQYNGFNQPVTFNNPFDNINLSLENLTQDLDMSAVAGMTCGRNDDVICTPDFPMEPLCEVLEDNDDDVECITPGPATTHKPAPKSISILAKAKNLKNSLPDLSPENIIQMTENDVTVNATTGGLKFRVDPQTLSSNKMYRLPDGRIFAINCNPNMPGGYSATIVAVTETGTGKTTKGATYAAKLSAVSSTPNLTVTSKRNRPVILKTGTSISKPQKKTTDNKIENTSRPCDMDVPVEWFRFNVIEAVDSLEYSLYRLQRLRTEASTMFLRTRTVTEMQNLHKNFDRLLQTSCARFKEIKTNVNTGFKQYLAKKSGKNDVSEDDDDVEILPNNDDPIFIDENSLDSVEAETIETEEVDLTDVVASDHNDSGEQNNSMNNHEKQEKSHGQSEEKCLNAEYCNEGKFYDDTQNGVLEKGDDNNRVKDSDVDENNDENPEKLEKAMDETGDDEKINGDASFPDNKNTTQDDNSENDADSSNFKKMSDPDKDTSTLLEESADQENSASLVKAEEDNVQFENPNKENEIVDKEKDNDKQLQDTEMSEDAIETLLKDEIDIDNGDSMDVS